jgi:hypothetical protein
MKTDQNPPVLYPVWVFVVLLMVLGMAHKALSVESADDVSYLLQQKMDSIQIMTDKIARQRQQADQLQRRLTTARAEYVEEIMAEMRRIRAVDLKQALHSARISHNLMLIGRIDGYLRALHERIDYYDAGTHRLKYLYAKAADDLMLVRTFTVETGERLVADIDGALKQYHHAATAPLFDVRGISEPETPVVWKSVVGGK